MSIKQNLYFNSVNLWWQPLKGYEMLQQLLVTRVIQWAFLKLSNKVQLSIDHHQNKDLLLAWLFACALLHHHVLMLIANDTYTQNW